MKTVDEIKNDYLACPICGKLPPKRKGRQQRNRYCEEHSRVKNRLTFTYKI